MYLMFRFGNRICRANHGQKDCRPSPKVITLRNLSNLPNFGLSGFTKKICGLVKRDADGTEIGQKIVVTKIEIDYDDHTINANKSIQDT